MAAPPLPPTGSGPTGSTNLGVAPNVAGLLCYAPCCIGLIFSIVAVSVVKLNRFLRFSQIKWEDNGAFVIDTLGDLFDQCPGHQRFRLRQSRDMGRLSWT